MADTIQPIQSYQPPVNATALQFAATESLTNPNPNTRVDNTGFSSALLPPELVTNIQQSFEADGVLTPQELFTESLLNIDNSSLSIFTDANSDVNGIALPNQPLPNGVLTPQQLQEMSILQQDALQLEEAFNLTAQTPLVENSTTVDLSAQAQVIAEANNSAATETEPTPLTQAQLEQIGGILEPLGNQPLTPALILQLQGQLSANQLATSQFNFSTLFQSYLASLMATSPHVDETHVAAENEDETVAPVSHVDRVGIEDSAILA